MAWFLRDHAAWLSHSKHRANRGEAYSVSEPKAPYAELIRSRYPTFADAVSDLDDALTTVALFSQMSGSKMIDSERIVSCRRLLTEFHYYIARTNSLSAAFISFRGFYFQAALEGQKILWLIPHSFPIPVDASVDYEVLLEFLELYEHLVGFVNARLFIQLGMKYPPVYDRQKWDQCFYIDSIVDSFAQPLTEEASVPIEPSAGADRMREALNQALNSNENNGEEIEQDDSGPLFARLVFTIHHGVPRDPVSFVIRALGGRIVWDENSEDATITHTIVDRPVERRFLRRVYVQPQWVFDCLNKKSVLPVQVDEGSYVPGEALPAHLSPFVGQMEAIEGIGDENDDREMIAVGDDSDQEIAEEVRRVAMEADFAEGMAAERGEDREPAEGLEARIAELKAEKLQQKKEEKARLAAGILTATKRKLYAELKEKEDSEQRRRPRIVDIEEPVVDIGEEEEEEEEANEA
jgi:pescadillo protein